MCRRPEQRGARGASARSLAWRLHHENPHKIGRLRRHHRLRPDRRRSLRRASLRNPARYRGRHSARAVICDKGCASKANRDAAKARGIAPVIPDKANEKNKPALFVRTLYKARARIEQGVGRLKRFKRIALRCEKTERNLQSNRLLHRRTVLDQIRLHGLTFSGP